MRSKNDSRNTMRDRSRGGWRLGARLLVPVALGALVALPVASSGAQSIDELNAKIASAQSEAESLGAEIAAKSQQVAAAQQQAAAAAQREAQLSAVLAEGQQREAELAVRVEQTQAHLARTRARLDRALEALSDRLIAIYKGSSPNLTELLL